MQLAMHCNIRKQRITVAKVLASLFMQSTGKTWDVHSVHRIFGWHSRQQSKSRCPTGNGPQEYQAAPGLQTNESRLCLENDNVWQNWRSIIYMVMLKENCAIWRNWNIVQQLYIITDNWQNLFAPVISILFSPCLDNSLACIWSKCNNLL